MPDTISSVSLSGLVIDTSGKNVPSLKIRFKYLAPDGFTLITVNDDKGNPFEVTTNANGEFTITVKEAAAIKKLTAQGHALLFKVAQYDTADAAEEGLSRTTPLYLSVRQTTRVVLQYVPQRNNGMAVPATPAQLKVSQVFRDGQAQRQSLPITVRLAMADGSTFADARVTALLSIPSAGKAMVFPSLDTAPTASLSEDGKFKLDLGRAGDLIPYQPYSLFPWVFRVTVGKDATDQRTAETPIADACFIDSAGKTDIQLFWSETSGSPPVVRVEVVFRDGKAGRPNLGTVEAVGRLTDAANGLPLRDYRVQVTPRGATEVLRDVGVQADGFFALPHPVPLDAPNVELAWTLRILDLQGTEVATGVAAKRDADSTDVVEVKLTRPKTVDSSPKVSAAISAFALKLDPKTTKALETAGIVTLQDILSAGGLSSVSGTELSDSETLRKLEQVADLWSVLPPGLPLADAIGAVKELNRTGVATSLLLGGLPRAEVTKRLQSKLGDFKAAQLQRVAAARTNLLNMLTTGDRVEAGYKKPAKARVVASDIRSPAPMATFSPESDPPAPECSCTGCQTAVSPNAYLVDLIRYTSTRMLLTGVPITVEDIEDSFHQKFAELPMSCASMDTPVLVSRIAIEVLRSYATTLDPLSTGAQDELDDRIEDYTQAAYDALLAALGTTTSELRLAYGDDDALTALADRLGLPSKTQAEALLLSSETTPLTEAALETLFGLRRSTLPPLDTLGAAQVLTWRTQRLTSAWAETDQIAPWPGTDPILDPDIIGLAYLRHGWDAAHGATVLWQNRRNAIDAKLDEYLAGRALAVGGAVVPIAQGSLGRPPNDDEKWAAYFVLTLSQDEVDSKAAKLPPEDQEDARKEAAQDKILAAKIKRSGDPDAELTDELATIDAILAYVGTTITNDAQTASVAWSKGLFVGLTPDPAGASASEDAWNARHAVLKGTATTPSLTTVNQDLAAFAFTTESFIRIWDLYLKNKNQGFRNVTQAEWEEFDALWVARWKRKQTATWLGEETSISVKADLFWKEEEPTPQRQWLGSPERLASFLDALDEEFVQPIVEPDLLANADFVDTGSAAYTLFGARQLWISTTLSAFATAKSHVNAATGASKTSVFDTELLAPALGVKATAAVPSAPAWYEVPGLQAAYDTGSMTSAHLDQLLLSRSAFNALFKVRSLIRALKPVSAHEWDETFNILLQVKKLRMYGAWRREEAAPGNQISLSPESFQLPLPPPVTFPPPPALDRTLPSWRATAYDLAQWRSVLAGRIQELADLKTAHSEMLLRVEARVLNSLRDALVMAYAQDGSDLSSKADWLTDRLLVDFKEGPASQTTRIAYAITTLQLLLYSASIGDLFRLRTSITYDNYPIDLIITGESFDSEWKWMGEYGSWRSAIFVFMYPENLLYPSLRSDAYRSEAMQTLIQVTSDSSPLNPEKARAIARQYQSYFTDVTHLYVNCTVTVRGSLRTDNSYARPTVLGAYDNFAVFSFGTSPSNLVYYCIRDLNVDNPVSSQWHAVPVWKNVKKLHGAAPFVSSTGSMYIVLVASIAEDDETTLQTLRLNLDKLSKGVSGWDDEPTKLASRPLPAYQDTAAYQYLVEQKNIEYGGPGASQPVFLYVVSPMNAAPSPGYGYNKTVIYRKALDDEGKDWKENTWPITKYVRDAASVLAAFSFGSGDGAYGFLTYGASFDPPPYSLNSRATLHSPMISNTNQAYWVADLGIGTLSSYNFMGCSVTFDGESILWFESDSLKIASSIYYLSYLVMYMSTGYPVLPNSHERTPPNYSYPLTYINNSKYELRKYVNTYTPPPYIDQTSVIATAWPLPEIVESTFSTNSAVRATVLWDYYLKLSNSASVRMLSEATFDVPMHLGLQLQQAGHYEAALAWFRSVYDWALATPDRKIAPLLLTDESTSSSDYHSQREWLADPFNPHAVAGTRPYTYGRFTLFTLVRAFLEYADAEFSRDTVESLPKARSLYQMALMLLETEELTPAESPCEEIVAEVDFSFVPGDWQEYLLYLRSSLSQTLDGMSPDARTALVATVVTQLKDTSTPQWSKRFSKARAAIATAQKAKPAPAKLQEVLATDANRRSRRQLAKLATPEGRSASQRLSLTAGRRFRAALSAVSGVEEQTLDANTSLKFDWLTHPAGKGKPLTKRSTGAPALVQPASAASKTYTQRASMNPLNPTPEALGAWFVAENPAYALSSFSYESETYIPGSPITFCIPPNPVLQSLRLLASMNLYKLRNGRNIGGQERAVEVYSAPTDAQTGLPTLGADGRLMVSGRTRLLPTQYRYSFLIERARRLVSLAAQFEQQLLSSLEKADNEQRSLLEARNNLSVQRSMLSIKALEVEDASLGVDLANKQLSRNSAVQSYYNKLIAEDVSALEVAALNLYGYSVLANVGSAALQVAAASVNFTASLGLLASSLSSTASALSTTAGILSTLASYERRKDDWQQQSKLATLEGDALFIQRDQATTRVQIKEQEQRLAGIQVSHAETVVDFLVTKFSSKELYEWMSRVLQGLYASQLQQATSLARLAQQQLSFDLAQDVSVIQSDYWTARLDSPALNSQGPDRRGLTGSARLSKDIEQLDVLALNSDKRKLQLTRTISLAALSPAEFQRFRENGEMWFETKESDFDLEFPGHYFRRIRRIRVSVSALVPPQQGIRATLSNVGLSRVTVPGLAGFDVVSLPPSNDAVSFTSPLNATGTFELDIQPELRLPFEGVGVDTGWHIELPKPANPIDYDSIVDVFINFEYTALYSPDYRAELMQNPLKLSRKIQASRAFSFRNELADQWYELHNAPSGVTELRVSFDIAQADFPTGLHNIRVQRLSLYMPVKEDERGEKTDLSQDPLSNLVQLAIGTSSVPATQAFADKEHLIMAGNSTAPWFRQLPRSGSPFGRYTLTLPATQAILDLFRQDLVSDILFAVSYEADLPAWPSGQKPGRLF